MIARHAESSIGAGDTAAVAVSDSSGGPGRARLVSIGVATLAAVIAVAYLQSLPLPYDELYRSVVYLMWSANTAQTWIPIRVTGTVCMVSLAVPLSLIAWAIVWPRNASPAAISLLRWCYRFAPCWPLLLLVSTSLGRVVANLVYALAVWVPGDVTPALARLEGPLLERLQGGAANPSVRAVFSGLYSWVWIVGLIGFGPWLVVRGRERAVSQVIVGTVLTGLLAVPFFLLLPAFDPWATNPMYGYLGPGQTAVRYLYPHADVATLSTIATSARWATGSCLPSLHIAFPLVFALIAARHRLRAEAWVLAAVTVAASVAVVFLGRHWIVDVVAAVPFAFGVRWLVERIDPRLALPWESGGRRLA